ncbi:hypothetical protein B0I35DRAFT_423948 [Stachybotrys elegans]|uniref:DUF8004 domain-containing protein n=1 Tax=Stachybotrys elegans TaxID=80388 RepID=A0A8K0SWU5_9HYPO|nr:hypothetical protein B0I35DRAFT_423948 [Stachybotrys elegans]
MQMQQMQQQQQHHQAQHQHQHYPQHGPGPSPSVQSSGSGGSGGDARRDPYAYAPGGPGPSPSAQHLSGGSDEFGYARPRRPTLKTEDISGIEKSGLRSMLDKRSEDVRKGIAKTFTFRKKDKDDARRPSIERPPSQATVRPFHFAQEVDVGYDEAVPSPVVQGNNMHQQWPQYPLPAPPQPQMPMHMQMPMQQQQQHQQSMHHHHHHQMPMSMPMPTPTQMPIMSPQYPPYHGSPPPENIWDPASLPDIWEPSKMMPPPNTKLPPIPQPPIKRWIGAGRPVARWNKLRKDPELWDPNGDVLVFLCRKGQSPRPPPSFRLSSHIIEATESRYLITLLREGFNEEDFHPPHLHHHNNSRHSGGNMPPSPAGAPPMVQDMRPGVVGSHSHLGQNLGRTGQPTPPVSEDASLLGEVDGQISYEMYFPTSTTLTRTEQLRHQLTTRNVFALLYHSSLVGLSLHQALTDLLTRLSSYMPADSDNVGQMLNYLTARGIDDVRGDPETAVSLLAWSESPEVRWDEGWRESFVHCAGMYTDLERCADFKHLTPITRALLERACLETQLRVQAAEERLMDFSYNDMWSSLASPAWGASDRLRRMLITHYTRIYGVWPPAPPSRESASSPSSPPAVPSPSSPPPMGGVGKRSDGSGEDMWLSRTVATNLQRDFGALYDYLVNRDVAWDVSEARSGRKWMMASASGSRTFEADVGDLPLTDMLIEFDNKLRFPHIPHPYPLVPESIAPMLSPPPSAGLFGGSRKESKGAAAAAAAAAGHGAASGNRSAAMERRVHLAYTESTNIYILGSDFTQSDLIDAFVKFEKTDKVGEVDPAMARLGRWVLIYGILQTLGSVSVDAPGLRYRDGVNYHISPRLRGTRIPPWKGGGGGSSSSSLAVGGSPDEACHELSHCWTVPKTWGGNGPSSSAESSSGSRSTSPAPGGGRGSGGNGGGGGGRRGWSNNHNTSSVATATTTTTTSRSVRSYASSSTPGLMSESDTASSSMRSPPASARGYAASSSSHRSRAAAAAQRKTRERLEQGGPVIRDFDEDTDL